MCYYIHASIDSRASAFIDFFPVFFILLRVRRIHNLIYNGNAIYLFIIIIVFRISVTLRFAVPLTSIQWLSYFGVFVDRTGYFWPAQEALSFTGSIWIMVNGYFIVIHILNMSYDRLFNVIKISFEDDNSLLAWFACLAWRSVSNNNHNRNGHNRKFQLSKQTNHCWLLSGQDMFLTFTLIQRFEPTKL